MQSDAAGSGGLLDAPTRGRDLRKGDIEAVDHRGIEPPHPIKVLVREAEAAVEDTLPGCQASRCPQYLRESLARLVVRRGAVPVAHVQVKALLAKVVVRREQIVEIAHACLLALREETQQSGGREPTHDAASPNARIATASRMLPPNTSLIPPGC